MLLKNAHLIDALTDDVLDVQITGTKISKIAKNISAKTGEKTLDLKGKILTPGATDLQFFLNSIASKKIESLEEAVQGARRGGATSLAITCLEPITSESMSSFLSLKLQQNKSENVFIIAEGVNGDALNDVAIMLNADVCTIRADSCINSNLLRRLLEYVKAKDLVLFCTPKSLDLDSHGVMHDGLVSSRLGLPPIASFSESSEIAKLISLALGLDSKVFFPCVSSELSVQILSKLGKKNQIFSSVGLNNLLMSDDFCENFNTNYKTLPPLRAKSDQSALINALKSGVIDSICSNHQPRSYVSKDMPFENASFGLANNAIFLPLIYTHLIQKNIFSWQEISKFISYNPALMLGLNKGLAKEGMDADLVVFDTNKTNTINKELFASAQIGNIALFNEKIQGEVEAVFVNGKQVI